MHAYLRLCYVHLRHPSQVCHFVNMDLPISNFIANPQDKVSSATLKRELYLTGFT